MSLNEIMSEQMLEAEAEQLAIEERERLELERVLALSAAEAGVDLNGESKSASTTSTPTTPSKSSTATSSSSSVWGKAPSSVKKASESTFGVAIAPTGDDDNDDDAAIAARLQAQFDREAELHAQSLHARDHVVDKLARVTVARRPGVFGADDFASPDLGEQDDEDEYYDEEDVAESDFDIVVNQSHNRAKHSGAAARLGPNVSKHDLKVASARHARQLVEHMSRSGDLSKTNVAISNKVYNQLNEHARGEQRRRVRRGVKEDAAVVDQVLDQSTRLKLLGLMNSSTLETVGGTIATGKESNVYHATGRNIAAEGEDAPLIELAVKIFSVSMSGFHKRQPYMEGERRFKGIANADVRKFIRVWAEKEMRNLCRLRRVGIDCPRPIALREHVLVMSFIGKDGRAAPKLVDVKKLSNAKWASLYRQTCLIMRTMFHDCKLVHSDLSEYNILYAHGKVVIIDVSHAIDSSNGNAATFLRNDCIHVTSFFAKKGVRVLSPRDLFMFIVDNSSNEEIEEEIQEKNYASDVTSDSDVEKELSIDLDNAESDERPELVQRATARNIIATSTLRSLLKSRGRFGVLDEASVSAADAAFMSHERLPRSLFDVPMEALFNDDDTSASVKRVNTFGLLADDVEAALLEKSKEKSEQSSPVLAQ